MYTLLYIIIVSADGYRYQRRQTTCYRGPWIIERLRFSNRKFFPLSTVDFTVNWITPVVKLLKLNFDLNAIGVHMKRLRWKTRRIEETVPFWSFGVDYYKQTAFEKTNYLISVSTVLSISFLFYDFYPKTLFIVVLRSKVHVYFNDNIITS